MKQSLTDWVLRYKEKGRQIVRIGGNYYLYKISSVWDPQKGKARYALKNVQHYFSCSHLTDIFSDAKVSVKSLSNVIIDVGLRRQKVVEFLKNFLKSRQYQVIDMTHVFSYSEDVISSKLGYNLERQYIQFKVVSIA